MLFVTWLQICILFKEARSSVVVNKKNAFILCFFLLPGEGTFFMVAFLHLDFLPSRDFTSRHMGCPCNYVFRTLLVAVLSIVIWLLRKTMDNSCSFFGFSKQLVFFLRWLSHKKNALVLSFALSNHCSHHAPNTSNSLLHTAYCTLRAISLHRTSQSRSDSVTARTMARLAFWLSTVFCVTIAHIVLLSGIASALVPCDPYRWASNHSTCFKTKQSETP